MIINGVNYPGLRLRGRMYSFDECNGDGKRRWITLGTDQAKAIAEYTKRRAAKPAARTDDAVDETHLIGRMLADAIEYLRLKGGHDGKGCTAATLLNYKSMAKNVEDVFRCHPRDITQADVMRYLEDCERMSFRGEIALLSTGYRVWMRDRKHGIESNPCFGVTCDRKGSKRTRLLTDDEVQRIIAAADERTAVAIELAILTGFRISDLVSLRWRDIESYIDTQKTGERLQLERTPELDAILARAKALQSRVASMFVLCNARGAQQFTTGALRLRWEKAVEKAKVADAHFHDLRAYAATGVFAEHGIDATQQFLGHRAQATTERYVRGLRPRTVRSFVRRRTA